MYFRRLEMQGFKSFAEKTVLEFGDGITAVVGPNGSGKSNISDAIRWVLGEQSPKSLRGGKMEDVIFSGTENRKPQSFAEVSIVMDNTDNTLNIDYETVKITRRLYRSGDSEYLINGKQARLKDINLLFADTGIGKEGYSIIGQGKVDEILSSKSEDRRGIFEEASGIMKYRIRKLESERKLAQSEQNLVRIDDIIKELEMQLSTLKRQAATAEQYLKFKLELRDIEVGVLTDGINDAEERLTEIKKNYDALTLEIEDYEAKANKVKEANEDKTKLSEKLENDYNVAKEEAFEAERYCGELNSKIALNIQKIESEKNDAARMQNENINKAKLNQELKEQLKQLNESSVILKKEVSEFTQELDKEQRKLDIVIAAISGGSQDAQKKNTELVDARLTFTKLQTNISFLEKQIEIYNQKIAEITDKISKGSAEKDDAKSAFDVLKSEFDQKGSAIDALNIKLTAASKTKSDLEALIEQKTVKQGDLKTAIDSADAQLKLLKEMEENFEGYAKSVKEILTLCKENPKFGSGIHGAVAQVITASKDDELAIETALGNTFQDIITEDEYAAKEAIEYLKENKLGRATFLPLTAVSPKTMASEDVKKLKNVDGYVGIAANLVEYKSKYEVVVQSLLGKVAVFEDIDSAIYAAKMFKYQFMCVTRDGDILRTSGAITGGSPEKGKRGGALSRTREIPELNALIEKGLAKYEKTTKEIESLKEQLRQESEEISKLTTEIRSEEIALTKLAGDLKACETNLNILLERDNELLKEQKAENDKILNSEAEIIYDKESLKALEEKINTLTGELSGLEESAKELDTEKERRQDALTTLKLRLSESKGKLQRVLDDSERIDSELKSGAELSEKFEELSKKAKENIENLTKENETLAKELEEKKQLSIKLSEKCNKLYESKKENDEGMKQSFAEITIISETIVKLRENASHLDVKRMRLEHDLDYNKTRLWEEYELTFTKALEITGGAKPENLDECKKRITELRNSIKRLGTVNVAAIEELKQTEERYNFLSEQRKDIEDSRVKLTKVISELESVMQKQFKEQFKIIRENFQVVFTELFSGGKADIVLSDESNVLECGIEINAQPPGKKLQNMLLLSGGERALTAIALLFAILRMRPTPFCMLDEIESALDDANVYRFANYTKNLSEKTQLILITHRKGTMESADSLYGVTMEEKGVSKVLSVRV